MPSPSAQLTATVIFPRIRSGMGPCTRFLSFSAQVPISSMAIKTSVCGEKPSGGWGVTVPLGPPVHEVMQGSVPGKSGRETSGLGMGRGAWPGSQGQGWC